MAPEQHAGRSEARSDQYCFCASMYEALCRVSPFAHPTTSDLAGRKARLELSPPRRTVPSRILRAIARGLEPDPAARFPSMGELLADLECTGRP
jgi:eukaryotic-like serine/threonine-protein kinase